MGKVERVLLVVARVLRTLALVSVTAAVTWAWTCSSLYWMSERELSRTALLMLESDTVILRETLDALQAATDRYVERTGSAPESLAQVIESSLDLCRRLPSGFEAWDEDCGVYDTDLGWFEFYLRGEPADQVRVSGCRWFGQKFGCVRFPDSGPPLVCSWCAERSVAIDGWRITLEPAPET